MAAFSLDDYVVDVLMRDLVEHDKSPSSFLVYLHLWKRTLGEARATVHQSHQQLSAATGLSKRSVQDAIKHLERRHLLRVKRTSPTAVPEYAVERPWRGRA